MVKFLSFMLIGAVMICCDFRRESDALTMERKPVDSRKLRLDGYYFVEGKGESQFVRVYFLYQNGILIYVGVIQPSNFDEIQQTLTNREFLHKVNMNIYSFGVYAITGDSIVYQKRYPGPGPPSEVYTRKGVIKNDSTFMITTEERPATGEVRTLREVYQFRRFSPKPDSVNEFIQ